MNIHNPPLGINIANKDAFEGQFVVNCELLELKSQLSFATRWGQDSVYGCGEGNMLACLRGTEFPYFSVDNSIINLNIQ